MSSYYLPGDLKRKYKFIDTLVKKKRYEALIKELGPFISIHMNYIISELTKAPGVVKKLDKLLKKCGKKVALQ